MCEQVANRAGRWSKERTYTRRAISSQYVVCACFCAQYIYSSHKKRTDIQSLISKGNTLTQRYFCFCMQAISIANAFAAFVYKLFPANIARYCCQLLRSSNYQPLQAWVKFAERGNFVQYCFSWWYTHALFVLVFSFSFLTKGDFLTGQWLCHAFIL